MGLLTDLLGDGNATSLADAGRPSGGSHYYLKPGMPTTSVSTTSLSADKVYYEPFIVGSSTTFDRIAIEVTTLGAGLCRLGIYNADDDWQPTSLVWANPSTVDVSTTGVKAVTISETLAPGRYLASYTLNVACSVRAHRSAAVIGNLSTLGASSLVYEMFVAKAYASLSDPGTAWNQANGSTVGFNHAVMLRAA